MKIGPGVSKIEPREDILKETTPNYTQFILQGTLRSRLSHALMHISASSVPENHNLKVIFWKYTLYTEFKIP